MDNIRVVLYMEMPTYQIQIEDAHYTRWQCVQKMGSKMENTPFNIHISPFERKLFHNDTFEWDCAAQSIKIVHSPIRNSSFIPGVILLAGNKTYGREKNKPRPKLLYKCVPDDRRLPPFLIPYDVKHLGFSKVLNSLYVAFSFNEWADKHPIGRLDVVIGSVNELHAFYEYQLYCKSLNASVQKLDKLARKQIDQWTTEPHDNIFMGEGNYVDRTNTQEWRIFTVDPLNSQDLDDGFSWREFPPPPIRSDMVARSHLLSIYISNVPLWMDKLELWSAFSRRVSTIYLPDQKRPMLPTILSDRLCSLICGGKRWAFVLDLFVDEHADGTCRISKMEFHNAVIRVSHNYTYEEPKMLADRDYQSVLELIQKIQPIREPTDVPDTYHTPYQFMNHIQNSHDVVCYLMIFMNAVCAKQLVKHHTGILRITTTAHITEVMERSNSTPLDTLEQELKTPDDLPSEVRQFIQIWKSTSGKYVECSSRTTDAIHSLLGLNAYAHTTSPIRRLVDLLNMMTLQKSLGLASFSKEADEFYSKWVGELDYINHSMRSIRKIQSECALLDICSNPSSFPHIMEEPLEGYVFDKLKRDDGLFQYTVYLPKIKMTSRINWREEHPNYTRHLFRPYLFHNEARFKRKIRLQWLSTEESNA